MHSHQGAHFLRKIALELEMLHVNFPRRNSGATLHHSSRTLTLYTQCVVFCSSILVVVSSLHAWLRFRSALCGLGFGLNRLYCITSCVVKFLNLSDKFSPVVCVYICNILFRLISVMMTVATWPQFYHLTTVCTRRTFCGNSSRLMSLMNICGCSGIRDILKGICFLLP